MPAGVPAGLIRDQERAILADLSWDLMPAAREVGAAWVAGLQGCRAGVQPGVLPLHCSVAAHPTRLPNTPQAQPSVLPTDVSSPPPPFPTLQARAVGLPDDECCADQQRQLAELALQPHCDGPASTATTPGSPESDPTWHQPPPQPPPQAPQQDHPHAGRLAELLASQVQVSLPPAAQRALQALLPTNLLPGGAGGGTQLSSQLAASSLDCLPSPTLLARLMAGGL